MLEYREIPNYPNYKIYANGCIEKNANNDLGCVRRYTRKGKTAVYLYDHNKGAPRMHYVDDLIQLNFTADELQEHENYIQYLLQ